MAGKQSSPTLPAPLRTAASALRRVPGAGAVSRAAEGALDKVGAVSPRGRRLAVYTGAGVLGVAGIVEWPVAITGAAVAWLTQPRPEEHERPEGESPAGELGEMRAGDEREVTPGDAGMADVGVMPVVDEGMTGGGTPMGAQPSSMGAEPPAPGAPPTDIHETAPPPGPGPVSTAGTQAPAGRGTTGIGEAQPHPGVQTPTTGAVEPSGGPSQPATGAAPQGSGRPGSDTEEGSSTTPPSDRTTG